MIRIMIVIYHDTLDRKHFSCARTTPPVYNAQYKKEQRLQCIQRTKQEYKKKKQTQKKSSKQQRQVKMQ